nr:hypothetical protein [Tanacetum cinerariifolium]
MLRVGDDEVIFDMDKSNIETKDKKGAENLAANHLSWLENPHMKVLTEREIADKFPDEHLMVLKSKIDDDEPWYADFVSYIVRKVVPPNCTFQITGSETLKMLAHCHSRPTGGHHSASVMAKKKIDCRAHWALKQFNMDLTLASKSRLMQLNELAKLRDGAYENTRIYKEQTKKWHDTRLRGDKDFKKSLTRTGLTSKSGQRLKKHYEGNIDKEDDEVIDFKNSVM